MGTLDTSQVNPTILAVANGLRLDAAAGGYYSEPWWKLDDVGYLCIAERHTKFSVVAFIDPNITNTCDLSKCEMQQMVGGPPKRVITTPRTASPWALERAIRKRLLPHYARYKAAVMAKKKRIDQLAEEIDARSARVAEALRVQHNPGSSYVTLWVNNSTSNGITVRTCSDALQIDMRVPLDLACKVAALFRDHYSKEFVVQ